MSVGSAQSAQKEPKSALHTFALKVLKNSLSAQVRPAAIAWEKNYDFLDPEGNEVQFRFSSRIFVELGDQGHGSRCQGVNRAQNKKCASYFCPKCDQKTLSWSTTTLFCTLGDLLADSTFISNVR